MSYVQTDRKLAVTTPLGKDYFLLNGFTGYESISRLFRFQLHCLADSAKKPAFDALLGQPVTVEVALPDRTTRYVNGICNRVAQGGTDQTFTGYQLDVVPKLWLLSRKTQSKIYQHVSVPDILKQVLSELDVAWEIQGNFEARDFCVQYRESDFAFASRLMEEEGIYYFFRHDAKSHTLVLANTPGSHKELPGKSALIFEQVQGGSRPEDRITGWEKAQEMRSGKTVLWDECFEMPKKHFETETAVLDSVAAGKSVHKLNVGVNEKLELYDFPGGYAQRFDGIGKGGSEQPSELQKIFQDKDRTSEIRMQEEASASVLVSGASNVRHLVSGFKFNLERHFEGEGPWVLYQIEHVASEAADVRSGRGGFSYQNHFTCFPADLPFRPPRVTPRPTVQGAQTAIVVGPPGEEIFTDKYGRIKVQFEWDRDGKFDSDSSCWVRVATPWAGKQWGAIHIPRVGQEVVVDFVEGDMDKPIVIGSVYNAEQMPPYKLPENKTQSGIKSRSSLGGSAPNFNEIRFEDKKGQELLTIHAEKNQSISVEADETHSVGHDRSKSVSHDERTTVGHDRTETVGHNETITITTNRTETVGANESVMIRGARNETVLQTDVLTVGGARTVTVAGPETETIGGALALTVGAACTIGVGAALTITASGTVTIRTGSTVLELKGDGAKISSQKIELAGTQEVKMGAGASTVTVKPDGVTISGPKVDSTAIGIHSISGAVIKLN